jgi:hypothetical protein
MQGDGPEDADCCPWGSSARQAGLVAVQSLATQAAMRSRFQIADVARGSRAGGFTPAISLYGQGHFGMGNKPFPTRSSTNYFINGVRKL